MKTINIGLYSHFFKHENLGCVALSFSNITLIDEALKQVNIKPVFHVFITNKNSKCPIPLKDIDIRYVDSMRLTESLFHPVLYHRASWLNDIDLVFNINGGDGFSDIYGIKRMIAELYPYSICRRKGIINVVAPQTIGPLQSFLGKRIAKKALASSNYIFSRDSMSTECAKNAIKGRQIDEVIDVAFALPFTRMEKKPKTIGLNVSGLLFNGGYNRKNYFGLSIDYRKFIERLVSEMCSRGFEVHLIGHVNSLDNEIEDDYRACEFIHQKYPQTILAPRFENPIDAKSYITQMEFFTGARMHSTIAAISSQTIVIPMAYSRKVNGLFASTLEYPFFIDLKSGNEIDEKIAEFFSFIEKKQKLEQSIEKAKDIYSSRLEQYKLAVQKIVLDNNLVRTNK